MDLLFNNNTNHPTPPGPSASAGLDSDDKVDVDVGAPLFYYPGKKGFYSPRQGKATPEAELSYGGQFRGPLFEFQLKGVIVLNHFFPYYG